MDELVEKMRLFHEAHRKYVEAGRALIQALAASAMTHTPMGRAAEAMLGQSVHFNYTSK